MSLDQAYANSTVPVALEPAKPIAFITAPAAADTSVIRDALRRRGYIPITLDEIPAPGRNAPDLLRKSILGADLVVAVIGDAALSSGVFYEIGFAQAMDKRILALAPLSIIPMFEGIACLRTEPTNREAIEFGLDQVLASPQPRRRPVDEGKITHPIGQRVDKLLADYRRARGGLVELSFMVSGVVLALAQSGVETHSDVADHGDQIDMAVWSDDLDPWIGNPLLVVITVRLDEQGLQRVAARLSSRLGQPPRGWGLIICGELGIPPAKVRATPNVLVVSLEEFLESLRVNGFGEYLSKLRIERLHAKD
jgi:hypothetical protein